MKNLFVILFLTGAAALLSGGCIRDNTDHCNNVIIDFSYLADDGQEHISEYVGNIDLYVFTDDGKHVMTVQYGPEAISSGNDAASFRLEEGRYRLYAVGNPGDRTSVDGTETGNPETIFIENPALRSGETVTGQDHLYLGSSSLMMTDRRYTVRNTVQLFSSHIDVVIEIKGLHGQIASKAGNTYTVCLENSNSVLDFNNRVHYGGGHTVSPGLVYDSSEGVWKTENLAVFRMDNGSGVEEGLCGHVLRIYDAEGKIVVEQDIYEYLSENADKIDVTLQEALLPIEICFSDTDITVSLPQWYIEDVTTDWD